MPWQNLIARWPGSSVLRRTSRVHPGAGMTRLFWERERQKHVRRTMLLLLLLLLARN